MPFPSFCRRAAARALATALLAALCIALLSVPAAIAENGGGGGHGGRANHGGNIGRGGNVGRGGNIGRGRYRDAGSRDHAGFGGPTRYRDPADYRDRARYRDHTGYCDERHYVPRFVYHPRAHYGYGPRLSVRFVFSTFPAAGYYYYDPYCGWRFGSLDVYLDHLYVEDHPWIVRVIDVGTGAPVYTYHWVDNGWVLR